MSDEPRARAIRLDASEMQRLDDALAPGRVSGARYTPAVMATIDR